MFEFTVKWNKTQYKLDTLNLESSIMDLKLKLFELTTVLPHRQKIMGIKAKNIKDQDSLQSVGVLLNSKLMMMGCNDELEEREEDENVVNDLDDALSESNLAYSQRQENLDKIAKRVETYQIKTFHHPRPGKNLLVLDIDGTIFDHKSFAERGSDLMRPYLHEFLNIVYQYYDIVIWSATNMKYLEAKVLQMGMIPSKQIPIADNANTPNTSTEPNLNGNSNNSHDSTSTNNNDNGTGQTLSTNPSGISYKLNFYLDHNAMINIYTEGDGLIEVKPLALIWEKYPNFYNAKNSIIVDDCRRNFLMNPQNGLKIYAYHNTHDEDLAKDEDLLWLGKYLEYIALVSHGDFTSYDHKKWKRYIRKKLAEQRY